MFVLGSIYERNWQKKMLDRPKYTIGIATTNWHNKNNNGVGTDYKYEINDMTFHGTTNWSYKKGDKFLVIFDSLKLRNCVVIGIYDIENDLKNKNITVPRGGWKYNELPFKIDSAKIRKYLFDWNANPRDYY